MDNTPRKQKSPLPAPSLRVTVALAAATLALGVGVGAAIGPAPSASFAGASGLPLPLLLRLLGAGAASRAASQARAASAAGAGVKPPPAAVAATPPSARRRRIRRTAARQSPTTTATSPTPAPETTTPSAGTPATKPTASSLAPVSKVWLIELAGSSFAEAAAQPSAAPYIDTQALPAGTLLSGWSALDASALASDAALLASSSPQLLDTILQPPCPASSPEGEGAAGAQCATDTGGALSAADQFLQQVLPTITATAAFRENGLVVVTFATVASAAATGLPSGASTATLTSQPPAGVLVISPFATAGARSSSAFSPSSPTHSLERLLHH